MTALCGLKTQAHSAAGQKDDLPFGGGPICQSSCRAAYMAMTRSACPQVSLPCPLKMISSLSGGYQLGPAWIYSALPLTPLTSGLQHSLSHLPLFSFFPI